MNREVFGEFEGRHAGQSCLFFGTGPTLTEFDDVGFSKDVVRIGSNELVHTDIVLDYYFIGDAEPGPPPNKGYLANPKIYDEYAPRIQKFVRDPIWRNVGAHGSSTIPAGMPGARYYKCHIGGRRGDTSQPYSIDSWRPDILDRPLYAYSTISFEALQFILFTGVTSIYLVGHDCDYTNGTFQSPNANGEFHKSCGPDQCGGWEMAKKYISENFPEVRILSVRPVGLKGLFDDVRVPESEEVEK